MLHSPVAHASVTRTVIAKVERVSDGEFITAITSNQTMLHTRLLGIDASEAVHRNGPGQPCGEED
jgi:endonuclease YncB( thermonuclease family)